MRSQLSLQSASDNPRDGKYGVYIPVLLFAAAWFVFFLTRRFAGQLAERWGPAPDVVDALGRDAFIANRIYAYYFAVVTMELIVMVLLLSDRKRRGWLLILKTVTTILLVVSLPLHAFALFITGLFAG